MRPSKNKTIVALLTASVLLGASSLSYAQPVRASTVEVSEIGPADAEVVILEAAMAAGAVAYAAYEVGRYIFGGGGNSRGGNRRPPVNPSDIPEDGKALEGLLDQ